LARLKAVDPKNERMNEFHMNRMSMKIFSLIVFFAMLSFPGTCLAIEVIDAAICKDVQGKQPVGTGNSFTPDVTKVWCWSKIKDGQGTIKHIYYHNGQEVATVVLNVLSPNFRTYSSKKILASQTGQWRVDIVDQNGVVLKSLEFVVGGSKAAIEPTKAEEIEIEEVPVPAEETEAAQEPVKMEEPTATEEQGQ
jgi:hypothetical protein